MGNVPENASLEPCDAKVAGEGFDLACVMCVPTNYVWTHQVEIYLYAQFASIQVENDYLCKHKNYFGRL